MTTKTRQINVRKNNGDLVPFDSRKLKSALMRAGAESKEADDIGEKVTAAAYDGITTKKIYQIAYQMLYKYSHRSAGRYRLKKAIQQMGPTGFPFEHFVARLFEIKGYEVETGILVKGRCISHEMDVVAKKEGKILMGECKFHRTDSAKNDVKISLYVHSRMEDVKAKLSMDNQLHNTTFEPMLITNTRFSRDAEKYGVCVGMRLISWDFPIGESLKDLVDKNGLHPITSLKALTKREKELLMQEGIVLCREVANNPKYLDRFNIPEKRKHKIILEAKAMV